MSDDWTLEGKNIDEPDCAICSTQNIYSAMEINILREKLIKDFWRFANDGIAHMDLMSSTAKRLLAKEMERKINKRFGVK